MKIIAITHQGLNTKYDHNEDSLVIDEQTISMKDFDYDKSFLFKRRGVFAVCDGVGGNFGGEIASHAIAQAIVYFTKEHEIKSEMDIYTLASTMKEGVENAHNEYGSKEMMSTFVGLFINKKQLLFANVGDSPSFIYRNGELEMMSIMDTYYNKLIASGMPKEEVEKMETAHYITAAFGTENFSSYSIHYLEDKPKKGDKYLLMSDGIYDYIKEDELSKLLSKYKNIKNLAKEMERIVLEKGANDNYSLIVIEY